MKAQLCLEVRFHWEQEGAVNRQTQDKNMSLKGLNDSTNIN